jgi:uncharacterized membrane protein
LVLSGDPREVNEEEKLWGFIAWVIPLIGGIVALVLRPNYRYACYWGYLSISFFIVIVGAGLINVVFSIIPFIGWILSALVNLGLLIIWIIGILRSLEKTWWKPPIIYDIARVLNPKIEEYSSGQAGVLA